MAAQNYSPMAPPPPSRPLGVAILAVLVGLFAILLILSGALVLVGGVAFSVLGHGRSLFGLPLVVFGAIFLIGGLIILAAALGLWHLRLWALVLALIFTFLEMLSYGLSGQIATVGFVFSLILFVYLLAVHRHFH